MTQKTLEYFARLDSGHWDHIGSSDITPGMLAKLRNHDIPTWMFFPIEVRQRVGGDVVLRIPAHDAGSDECCAHCKAN